MNMAADGLKVLKNEGLESFLRKTWALMTTASTPSKLTLAKDFHHIEFPVFDSPEATIVIPVFNKCIYTFNCLKSIVENTNDIGYEVIVVDNASTDATQKMLSIVKNITVILNKDNLGFVDACNQGAAAAKGTYIHFLNNDTVVKEGWLSALVQIFKHYPTAGAVGSKLIYPNNKLQEAGGIVWKDASAWNYGKFNDPEKPEYNYVREVDYCSGASLMVKRELFEKIGGFDMRYSPGYWEDADLCFSVRQSGYKVFYQPASTVVHFEGISSGTSTSSGMKRYQDINKAKFVEKWSGELTKQFENRAENVFRAKDRNGRRTIIAVDQRVPEYDKDAGSFFMYSLLSELAGFGYRVIFWPHHLTRLEPYTAELQQKGIEVMYGTKNFAKFMLETGTFIDVAVLTRTHIAIDYINIVRKHIPKVIYHDPDFEYVREKRRSDLEGGPAIELKKIKEREFYLFSRSDIITTVNEQEAELISAEMPGKKISVIHHPISKMTDMSTPFEDRMDLLFVGSSHPPNTDAILFLSNEIMPLLLKQAPDIKLYVIGDNTDKRLKGVNTNHIIFTGFVKELLPYYEKCRVFVAPLRYGAGVKGKVIDAMSYGLPVVTTTVGAEGLGVINGEHMLIADNKEVITDAIFRLYRDDILWKKISENSKKHIAHRFSRDAFRGKIKALMGSLLE